MCVYVCVGGVDKSTVNPKGISEKKWLGELILFYYLFDVKLNNISERMCLLYNASIY